MKPRKQAIFNAAANLFKEKGYPASSIRELATKVGLEPSSIYSHVKSKEEILNKICFDAAQIYSEDLDNVLLTTHDPEEQIIQVIQTHVEMALTNPSAITVFNDEWRHLNEDSLIEFKKLRKGYENKLSKILERGMEQGIFAQMDIKIALNALLSSLKWIHYWQKGKSTTKLNLIQGEMVKFILKGIAK